MIQHRLRERTKGTTLNAGRNTCRNWHRQPTSLASTRSPWNCTKTRMAAFRLLLSRGFVPPHCCTERPASLRTGESGHKSRSRAGCGVWVLAGPADLERVLCGRCRCGRTRLARRYDLAERWVLGTEWRLFSLRSRLPIGVAWGRVVSVVLLTRSPATRSGW